jgi:hypothetical protein
VSRESWRVADPDRLRTPWRARLAGDVSFDKEIAMKKLWSVLLGCAFVVLASTAAHAQATRTWVSGVGDDVNPCSRTAPCRTFPGAISKTAAHGEINAIDSGGFGTVTITKSITINGDAALAGILAAGTNGVIINAGASDVVTLRNLDINGVGTGLRGIRLLSAGTRLHIENCTIYGFTDDAIEATVAASNSKIFIKDSWIRDNTRGIFLGGNVTATLDNVRVEQNGFGVRAIATSDAVIRNSLISGNSNIGVAAVTGGVVNILMENSASVNNGSDGVQVSGAGATIRLSNTTITGNTTGITVLAGGAVVSFGNNRVINNTTDGAPTSTIGQQ